MVNPINTLQPDAYDKLADNTYIVCKGYFAMSRRLDLHRSLSQWTLSLLSLGLIIIPLLTVTKVPVRYPQNVVDFASISLAVGVLVFSLLIGGNNYAVRSERTHICGLELNELLREMRAFAKDPNRTSGLADFEARYTDILKRNENYEQIDYTLAKIRITREGGLPWSLWSVYWFGFCREMFIYAVAFLLEFGFIYFLVTPRENVVNQVVDPAPLRAPGP